MSQLEQEYRRFPRPRRGLHIGYEVRKNVTAERRRHLLVEFLERKFANTQEVTSSQDLEIPHNRNQVTLDYDLLFVIFSLLPAESLFRLQFVCKKWFSLINSSVFTKTHHALQSGTVLICRKLTLLEAQSLPSHGDRSKPISSYFHFLDLDHGGNIFNESSLVELVDIRASHDGLILATMEKNKKRLILMNPVTRKHIELPFGEEVNSFRDESFGTAFCDDAKTYKVVHLFREKSTIGCEVLNIWTRRWTRISESPPPELFRHTIKQTPVSVGGSLYWMPTTIVCDNFVSMSVTNEKFVLKKLPDCRKTMDSLVEIGGNLGYVTHPQFDELDVWILVVGGGGSRESWMKRYSVPVKADRVYRSPVCGWRNGKGLVFESPGNDLYGESFESGEMEMVYWSGGEAWFDRIDNLYIPHRNTLVSWEDHHHS